MKIDKKLNMVIPVTLDDKSQVFIHSTPIRSEVFDAYFLPIAKTFSAIYSEGLGIIAGPRIADKMLRKVATDLGVWDGPAGVQVGLVAEIHRNTLVLSAAGGKGWEMIPYDHAAKTLLSRDDLAEIEAALTFFTVASAMHRKTDLPGILDGATKLWGARIELSTSTEFMTSLPTPIVPGSIGAMAAA